MSSRKEQIEEEAFWSKVLKTENCWEWTGWINSGGYGNFSFNRKIYSAHRHVLNKKGLHIPKGFSVDHRCRNRRCVNPEHLSVVTDKANVLFNSKGMSAINRKKTKCPRGHSLSGSNLMIQSNGRNRKARRCRICERKQFKKYWDTKGKKVRLLTRYKEAMKDV